MSEYDAAFNAWYAEKFGDEPGSDDPNIRDAIRFVWNDALEYTARHFDFQIFDEYTGNQLAEQIRAMKVHKEKKDGADDL